ncbi:putative protein kinase [Trypanosoma rangeli]|uniref:Protein kinase n=1 Tax=Trypanosoma rangeli TaxID=5698 RepID=A0A3S5IQS7_TRYRA|nr:putative protein kinase [Trypanosoma rangeli]RNF02123.1 putative protein kinase [Trypanosoma rangeli]|eukprot:RNF02123.1 putative protein kinase [Trypanosoma rangeli]
MPITNEFTGSSLLEDEAVVLKDYVIGQRLGEGSFGSVYHVTYVPSGEKFALKILQNDCFFGCESRIIQEATVMQSLEHPYVVKLYKFLQSTSSFYFVLELAEGGELFDLIISETYFSEENARRYFQQLISAIDYCHGKGVAHGDLKAENLLLGKNKNLLVCDFGFSSRPELEELHDDDTSEQAVNLRPIGTLHYNSPEAISDPESPAAQDPFLQDLWSAGVILFFMLTGRLPFDGRSDEETLRLIQRGTLSFQEEEEQRLTPSARSILLSMLGREPTDRPTLQQIIEDEWFGESFDAALFPHRKFLKRSVTFLDFSKQHRVTREEEDALRAAFDKIAIDGYENITRDEIRDMLATLHGSQVEAEVVSELMQLLTGDAKSKFVTYGQFRDAWVNKGLGKRSFRAQNDFQLLKIMDAQTVDAEKKEVRQLRSAFDSVDVLHTGAITVEQCERLFERCNISATAEDIQSLMRFFDEPNYSGGRGITFDKFVKGVMKREVLVRHPMGKKLADATNLSEMRQLHNENECVNHGFFVAGEQDAIAEKLRSCQERLMPILIDDVASKTETVHSFRYRGSAAMETGITMEFAMRSLPASANEAGTTLGMDPFIEALALGTPLARGSGPPSLSKSLPRNSFLGTPNGKHKTNGLSTQAMDPSTQAAVMQTRRKFLRDSSGSKLMIGVCDVDVILASASPGYTLVRLRRIQGLTNDFHEAVAYISSLLKAEREQAMNDILPCGESELL